MKSYQAVHLAATADHCERGIQTTTGVTEALFRLGLCGRLCGDNLRQCVAYLWWPVASPSQRTNAPTIAWWRGRTVLGYTGPG
jgi:hypothetical protein